MQRAHWSEIYAGSQRAILIVTREARRVSGRHNPYPLPATSVTISHEPLHNRSPLGRTVPPMYIL